MTVDLTKLKVGDTIVRRDGEVRIITNIYIYNHNDQGYYCSLDWRKKTPNSLQNSNVAYTQDGYWDSRRVTDSWDIVDIIPQKEPNDIINIHKAKTFKRTFNSKDSPTLNLVNCALGLGGEAGEVVDLIKKSVFYGEDTASELVDVKLPVLNKKVREKLKNEIGDVIYYLQGICDIVGLSLEECMEANIDKLYKRFPDKFSEGLASKKGELE